MQYQCQHNNQSKLLSACWLSLLPAQSHSSQLPSARLQRAAMGAHASSQPSEFSLFQKEASPVSTAEIVVFTKPSPSVPAHCIPAHATKHLPDPVDSLHMTSVMLTARSRRSAALPQAGCPKPPAPELNASTSCRRSLSPAAPLPAFCMALHAT